MSPASHYTYDADHYQYVYAALHDLTGGYAAGVLSDGSTIEISVEEGEMGDYTLIMQDGTGAYLETGYTWCSYNYPEEEAYNEAYPPDQYDCFTLSLDVYDCSYDSADGSIPERYALDEYEERWFLLYYAPETGEVVLEDLDGERPVRRGRISDPSAAGKRIIKKEASWLPFFIAFYCSFVPWPQVAGAFPQRFPDAAPPRGSAADGN